MARPRTDKPLLTIKGLRGYFNAAAIAKCKIGDNSYFEIVRVLKEKEKFYIRFNRKKKGFRCGPPTKVRQSQIGMKRVLVAANFEGYEGVFGMKKMNAKRTWRISMKGGKN